MKRKPPTKNRKFIQYGVTLDELCFLTTCDIHILTGGNDLASVTFNHCCSNYDQKMISSDHQHIMIKHYIIGYLTLTFVLAHRNPPIYCMMPWTYSSDVLFDIITDFCIYFSILINVELLRFLWPLLVFNNWPIVIITFALQLECCQPKRDYVLSVYKICSVLETRDPCRRVLNNNNRLSNSHRMGLLCSCLILTTNGSSLSNLSKLSVLP